MSAKSIMIQGTASSVGKSIIASGLCRVFKQDGYNVSPFKAQNMALNSFITTDGKEIGRAQAVQAEAAGKEPSVLMNPILLKPTTIDKSQVIIKGEVFKVMSTTEYHDYKPQLAKMIKETYNSLAEKNDIMVIEGAGSAVELNLKEAGFVNMGMAEIADAPVILVGDIDKGGVFASLIGTMFLLSEEEKKRVKGIIINKFSGDVEVLKPGLKALEEIIKVPVIGVLPYSKIDIEDEDSLAEKFTRKNEIGEGDIDVVVIKLPYISNFTDFNALENVKGVKVRYVKDAHEIHNTDLVILPGSKNTMEDMLFLRKSGMESEIKKLHSNGTTVFGICGGYQMLGSDIEDPISTDTGLYSIKGMGLLNSKTVFQSTKVTTQVKGRICDEEGLLRGLKDLRIHGYEIHMGRTEYMEDCIPCFLTHSSSKTDESYVGGIRNKDGNVYGTYIHGLFDNMDFTKSFINNLREKKGLARVLENHLGFKQFKEMQYDKLAQMLRMNLDLNKVYEIIEKS